MEVANKDKQKEGVKKGRDLKERKEDRRDEGGEEGIRRGGER